MNELKTLNEINPILFSKRLKIETDFNEYAKLNKIANCPMNVIAFVNKDIVFKENLKSEAIKWIKALEKNYLTLTEEAKYNSVFERGLIARGKIEFIKHFFNITDDELSMR